MKCHLKKNKKDKNILEANTEFTISLLVCYDVYLSMYSSCIMFYLSIGKFVNQLLCVYTIGSDTHTYAGST